MSRRAVTRTYFVCSTRLEVTNFNLIRPSITPFTIHQRLWIFDFVPTLPITVMWVVSVFPECHIMKKQTFIGFNYFQESSGFARLWERISGQASIEHFLKNFLLQCIWVGLTWIFEGLAECGVRWTWEKRGVSPLAHHWHNSLIQAISSALTGLIVIPAACISALAAFIAWYIAVLFREFNLLNGWSTSIPLSDVCHQSLLKLIKLKAGE